MMRSILCAFSLLAMLGGCSGELPSDEEIERVANKFEECERQRIAQREVEDTEDYGFSDEALEERRDDEKAKSSAPC